MRLKGFPRSTLRADQTVHRIHQAAYGPWWFSNGSGRFDPVGTGRGECYLSSAPLGAWVEVFRDQTTWAESDVQRRRLLSVKLGRKLALADVTASRALEFGVTAQLGAGSDTDASREFAAEASEAGYDGVRYWLRHDPRQKSYGYAIFDTAGESTAWPNVSSEPLNDELVAAAVKTYRYRILPRP